MKNDLAGMFSRGVWLGGCINPGGSGYLYSLQGNYLNLKIYSMLELKPICEQCGKPLPPDALDAMICTFECTYCKNCVDTILFNVCPKCKGGFEKRPIRTKAALQKYPATTERIFAPLDPVQFKPILEKFKDVKPEDR